MTLVALGLNHQTAPVALRERLAIDAEALPAALADLRATDGVLEAALLSTCNRTELYCRTRDDAEAAPLAWLARFHQIERDDLTEFTYRHAGQSAVAHAFRVATGLDSLILGEPQILGQMKQAYHAARGAGALGPTLERLFQQSFNVAKRARTQTAIGAHPVSVAFAAVRLAGQIFGALSDSTALMIGAGETIELAARHLKEAEVRHLIIANRTLANAKSLAEQLSAVAAPLAELERHLHEADIVIASTASREPLLTRAMVAAALKRRRHKPMLLIDLAVPRDVEPEVAELDDVFVYTVDDLGAAIEESMKSRRAAATEAESIVALEAERFLAWTQAQDATGPLKRLRERAERERDAALARAREALAAGKPADDVVAQLAQQLTNKLLHAPSANLRSAALRGDHELLRSADRLFDAASGEEA